MEDHGPGGPSDAATANWRNPADYSCHGSQAARRSRWLFQNTAAGRILWGHSSLVGQCRLTVVFSLEIRHGSACSRRHGEEGGHPGFKDDLFPSEMTCSCIERNAAWRRMV